MWQVTPRSSSKSRRGLIQLLRADASSSLSPRRCKKTGTTAWQLSDPETAKKNRPPRRWPHVETATNAITSASTTRNTSQRACAARALLSGFNPTRRDAYDRRGRVASPGAIDLSTAGPRRTPLRRRDATVELSRVGAVYRLRNSQLGDGDSFDEFDEQICQRRVELRRVGGANAPHPRRQSSRASCELCSDRRRRRRDSTRRLRRVGLGGHLYDGAVLERSGRRTGLRAARPLQSGCCR